MMIDQRDDRIIIISPIEGTPAYRKGLRAGDVIMSIDSNDTHGMKTSDASKLMRGKAGTLSGWGSREPDWAIQWNLKLSVLRSN